MIDSAAMTETDVPMPLKASEVAPDAFSAKSATVDDKNKEDDLDYDIGNLAAFDVSCYCKDHNYLFFLFVSIPSHCRWWNYVLSIRTVFTHEGKPVP